jgi:2-dehydro-3-deoxyphosphogluconate aldolase/(4S)-4-hydroxy-2-oxoglutarate aldolase
MDLNKFKQLPILGILRGIDLDMIEPLTETIISSGLKTIEVAMNTNDASEIIKKIIKLRQGRLVIGAGTILTLDDLHTALDVGATFIVLPVVVPEVVEYCAKNKIPVFPGALTPQEIYNAWCVGATMVKVFPAKFFGPEYFKEIKGPFKDIELLACGGVTLDNIRSFFSCGASAVAFGASVFKKEWLESGNFSRVEKSIKALVTEFAGLEAEEIIKK